jgi:pimeloyl-ACP methyl ester carboxylesterase
VTLRLFLLGVALLALFAPSPVSAQAVDSSPDKGSAQQPVVWVLGGPFRLRVRVFTQVIAAAPGTLVVVLHGDSPFANPGYQDVFASRVAREHAEVVVAAILRPGYTDPQGNTSEGERGQATGDNYNARNTDAVAQAIEELIRRYRVERTVVVGHSGGAAIAANILGTHPDLVDAAVLVSCPCDVERWRAHMLSTTKFEGFRGKISTLSPITVVGGISPQVRVTMLVGADDDIAPPSISQAYRDAAVRQGKHVELQVVPGEGHDVLMIPAVLEALDALLRHS